ncbi:MAG: glutathione S-transferase family protein, partial [Pseudomonadota bacterium]
IFQEIGNAYLPFLNANAEAWKAGQQQFDAEIQGVPYQRIPTSQYRVWCLEQLRTHFAALPEETQAAACTLLEQYGCWQPLFQIEVLDSRYDPEGEVPFRGRKVHYHNQ